MECWLLSTASTGRKFASFPFIRGNAIFILIVYWLCHSHMAYLFWWNRRMQLQKNISLYAWGFVRKMFFAFFKTSAVVKLLLEDNDNRHAFNSFCILAKKWKCWRYLLFVKGFCSFYVYRNSTSPVHTTFILFVVGM